MAKKRKIGSLVSKNIYSKRYPGAGMASTICVSEDEQLWLPSRVLPINHQLGGGLVYGHILELYGEENVGKTLLAMDFGVVAQALDGVIIWADAEGTFNGPWAIRNGLDLSKIYLYPSEQRIELLADWIADTVVMARNKLTKNQPILLVIDSLAALETLENLTVSQVDAKAEMGNRAKAIDAFLRRRNHIFHKYGISCLFINQLRKKIGASQFEDPDTTPGGQAMKFYASQRLALYKGAQIKDEKSRKVGRVVYSRLHKTKVAIPTENIKAKVYFRDYNGNLGYDKYFGFIEILEESGILIRKKARYYLKGKDKMLANGEEAMENLIRTDDDLRRKLIRKCGILTISKARERIENTKTNLYPVNVKKEEDEQ